MQTHASLRAFVLAAVMLALACNLATPGFAQEIDDEVLFSKLSYRMRSISEMVDPCVVQIFTAAYGPVGSPDGRVGTFGTRRGSGSGVVLDPKGFIVTNAHVVDGARKVQVLLSPQLSDRAAGESIVDDRSLLVGARIVGVDRETDIAVLKVEYPNDLPFLKLGNSDQLFQGQMIFAFGSPLGLTNSMSMGVVSSKARQLENESPMIYIQTDAAVNPGNSGGPLVTATGEVVGINTLIFSQSGGYEGISFAAPSNIVSSVYEQLRAYGRVRRGTLFVTAETINPWMASGLGLSQNHGVILADVYPKGPGDSAGLRVGDIVQTLDGKVMENARQFHVNVYGKPIDQKVSLEILRGGKKQTIQVMVMERTEPELRFFDLVTPQNNLIRRLGILALDLDDETRRLLPQLRKNKGVIVAAPTSDASVLGQALHPGDVIYSLNGRAVTNLKELRQFVKDLGYGDPAVFQVERERRLMFLTMQID